MEKIEKEISDKDQEHNTNEKTNNYTSYKIQAFQEPSNVSESNTTREIYTQYNKDNNNAKQILKNSNNIMKKDLEAFLRDEKNKDLISKLENLSATDIKEIERIRKDIEEDKDQSFNEQYKYSKKSHTNRIIEYTKNEL